MVYLDVSPALRDMLGRMREVKDTGRVFDELTVEGVRRSADRISKKFKGPAFTRHGLRRMCKTFLVMSNVYGSQARALDLASRQLRHTVEVADRHYVGDMRGVQHATTLEEAMGIEELVGKVLR